MGDGAAFCPVCGASAGAAPEAIRPDPAPVGRTSAEDGRRSARLREAREQEEKATCFEDKDPSLAAALYRGAIIHYLDVCDDALEDEEVRSHLLFVFDRLTVMLTRCGQPDEALEEIDCASSLGLLDCQDSAVR
jgi:hypothetical protein